MTSELRRLALAHQGLTSPRTFGTGESGALRAMEHLGYVQIDTLAVVERAHHHVLWSRVPGYEQDHLNQLVSKGQIFDYWFHAASYLPMRDYRFALRRMTTIRQGENRYYKNLDTPLMREILARVRAEGPTRARDFERRAASSGKAWGGRPVRAALDTLFMMGELMICRRDGMEKVYELSERVLPEGLDLSIPTLPEVAAYLFKTTRRAHGVFTWKQLLHLQKGKAMREAMRAILDAHLDAGEVEEVVLNDGSSVYVDLKAQERARSLESAFKPEPTLQILSPFDNAVIHRDRLSSLFGFDYRLESYVTASKRHFGYFCLPVLFGDAFVARIDAKAHRAEGRLEVLSVHLEDVAFERERFFVALNDELRRFATFNGCSTLDVRVVEEARRG
ncbi:winged helix-turn-helix domain-containing protein [Bradymonadaceae bacterium TMQ3]|nr:winged helix-turn-helix domain-containing protein [Bradymonadaceae bacterium TMQ3]TXC76502.1 winged helix-turn-helix domain-containing protein [Bradymonadales bacterium TMQ1]